ncbi:hypothetical protein [Alicyclobacillus dauci]|uniref:Uncharacterized protein n=1 Tax=Alicyclobacillus dauci TaxID=1475485 RepID=A0ABY6Z4H9_9BACL|nr:hypothetical protein [Alicyclobacillus dauci]WAH36905.1 hypothetical protein NZD86_22535 [Alicyclobacillus dauci]
MLSTISLGFVLLAGFVLLLLEHGRSFYQGLGGFMMLGAVVTAGAIDIRLRSPELRKS